MFDVPPEVLKKAIKRLGEYSNHPFFSATTASVFYDFVNAQETRKYALVTLRNPLSADNAERTFIFHVPRKPVSGVCGTVYFGHLVNTEAHTVEFNKSFALKLYTSSHDEIQTEIAQECAIMSELYHCTPPICIHTIVRTKDKFSFSPQKYATLMEKLPGKMLHQIDFQLFSLKDRIKLIITLLSQVSVLHHPRIDREHRIIHCDILQTNILIDYSKSVVLTFTPEELRKFKENLQQYTLTPALRKKLEHADSEAVFQLDELVQLKGHLPADLSAKFSEKGDPIVNAWLFDFGFAQTLRNNHEYFEFNFKKIDITLQRCWGSPPEMHKRSPLEIATVSLYSDIWQLGSIIAFILGAQNYSFLRNTGKAINNGILTTDTGPVDITNLMSVMSVWDIGTFKRRSSDCLADLPPHLAGIESVVKDENIRGKIEKFIYRMCNIVQDMRPDILSALRFFIELYNNLEGKDLEKNLNLDLLNYGLREAHIAGLSMEKKTQLATLFEKYIDFHYDGRATYPTRIIPFYFSDRSFDLAEAELLFNFIEQQLLTPILYKFFCKLQQNRLANFFFVGAKVLLPALQNITIRDSLKENPYRVILFVSLASLLFDNFTTPRFELFSSSREQTITGQIERLWPKFNDLLPQKQFYFLPDMLVNLVNLQNPKINSSPTPGSQQLINLIFNIYLNKVV